MSFLLFQHGEQERGEQDDTLEAALAFIDDWTATDGDCSIDLYLGGGGDDLQGVGEDDANSDDSRSSQSLYPASDSSELTDQAGSSTGSSESAYRCTGGNSSNEDSGVEQDSLAAVGYSLTYLHQQRRGPKSRCSQLPPPPAKKMRTSAVANIPPPRRTNKIEILELREEVLHLKAHFAQLRNRGSSPSRRRNAHDAAKVMHRSPLGPRPPPLLLLGARATSSTVDPNDKDQVEFYKLHQSEALNRTLKAALAKQISMGERLQNLFKKQMATILDLDFLVDTENGKPQVNIRSDPLTRDDACVFAELFRYLERSRQHIAAINCQDTTRVSSSSHVHQDPQLGQVFEFTTNAPLDCSLKRLDRFVWSHLACNIADKGGKQLIHKKSEPMGDTTEMRFTLTYNCKFGEIHADGRTVMRRYDEPNRVVIVYTSLLLPPSTGLQFRQNGCLILSEPSDNSDSTSSLLQTYYRIHAEPLAVDEDVSPHLREHVVYFRDFILSAQSVNMRAYQLQIQDLMLREFSSHNEASSVQGQSGVLGCIAA